MDLDAVAGQPNRGQHHIPPRQRPVLFMGQCQSAYRSGDTHRAVGGRAVVRAKQGRRGDFGCRFTILDADRRFVVAGTDQHETATADVAGVRPTDRHGEGDRDRRVDGVAAARQDGAADAAGRRRVRHDHALMTAGLLNSRNRLSVDGRVHEWKKKAGSEPCSTERPRIQHDDSPHVSISLAQPSRHSSSRLRGVTACGVLILTRNARRGHVARLKLLEAIHRCPHKGV